MLSFTLLGQIVLSKDGAPLSRFRSQKEAALLIYLAHTGQSHQRDFLADLLWESSSTKQSLSNLRTALTRLRKKVKDELMVTRKSVALTAENQRQVDSVLLLEALEDIGVVGSADDAATLQNALDAYQGEFLADFHLSDAPHFNEWVVMTREHIRRQVIAAYDKLGQYALSTRDVDGGITIARRWLGVDGLDETAHTLLIQMLLKAGNKREAVDHYEYCVELLQSELGVVPPARMTALIKDARPKRAVVARHPAVILHNLPAEYDQFFGRKTVQDEIHSRLDQPWCRLVTVVGQGGVGKTRLAATIARSRLSQFRDGVWLVELAEIDPDDEELAEAIAVEIATVLDLRLTGSEKPAEQLLGHLQHKEMMLVLDNFEHLLEGVQIVLDIVERCENVQLLVTSREALKIRAEWTIGLTGLGYPASDRDEMPSNAVELFVARRAQQRQGVISAENLTAIRTICRMVEGLPLAIELAAAMTRSLSPRAVADSLQDGFDALTTSLRDMPQRHQGLHIVFEMSWQTLTPDLQRRLARLALFRGGFTQTAALHIAEAEPQQLSALQDKSLLAHQAENDRYTMHPIIRAYAAEKRPSTDPSPQKHADYYLNLLAQHAEPLQKDAPQEAMRVIEPDSDNVRLAWQTGLAQPNFRSADLLLAALTPLSIYYQLRGLAREAETVMQTTADTAVESGTDSLPLAVRAGLERARFQNRLGRYRPAIQTIKTALEQAALCEDTWAGGMGHVLWGESLWRLGEYDTAEAKLNHALNIAQTINATEIIGWCHHHLGIINDIQSRYVIAHEHLQQACAAWRTIGNAQALSNSLNSVGLVCYHQGDLPTAQEAMEQALTICNQLDNRHLQSLLLNNLSMIATEQSDYSGAQYYLQLSLELAKTSGNLAGQGLIYTNLGRNYRLLGEHELAIVSLEEGLQISETIGERTLMVTAMVNLANTKSGQGNLKRAESLYGQALKIAQQDNLQHLECAALIGMAELLSEVNGRKARKYSTKALVLAKSIQNPSLLDRAIAVDNYLNLPADAN